MLSAFLLILKFAAIIFVFILLLFLILALIIIFGGIKYYTFAERKEELYVNVKISFIKIFKFVLN